MSTSPRDSQAPPAVLGLANALLPQDGQRARKAGPWLAQTMAVVCLWTVLWTMSGEVALGFAAPPDPEAAQAAQQVERARRQLQEARDLGAKRDLPRRYAEAEAAVANAARKLAAAGSSGPDLPAATAVQEAALLAERLVAQARFVKELRSAREPWEAAVSAFSQGLREIALAAQVELDSTLAGPAAARSLARTLDAVSVRRRVVADSLALASQISRQRWRSEKALQDSIMTALQVEVSHLRRQLWEAELKAGLAEADRSAVASDLDRRREREAAIQRIGEAFGPQQGEVLLTPEGDVIIRVFGFSFAVGSAELGPGGRALIDKLADAIRLFPGAKLRVEGHTDDTGSRQVNLTLSRQRAESVAKLLSPRIGVALPDIQIAGLGPDRPLAPNSTPEGQARNRRIDVVIQAANH